MAVSEEMNRQKIFILTGPGHHDQSMIQALDQHAVTQISLYPEPGVRSPAVRRTLLFRLYSHISWFIWGASSRLPYLKTRNRLLDFLFPLYDLFSSFYLNQPDIMIGWSQVSLRTLKKAKDSGAITILESPMVHINEWMEIMEKEYVMIDRSEKKQSLFTETMRKRMIKEYEKADYIQVLSTYAASSFLKYGIPESKILVTIPGIDTRFFIPEWKKTGKLIFLYAGRLQLLKGVHVLLQTFKKLGMENAELWLAGPVMEEIEPFLVNTCNVKVLGFKNSEELRNLYYQVDVLILPSLSESFGLVMLEAMACGTPVIASKNTGAPDVIENGKNGFVYNPTKPSELSDLLRWCTQNTDQLKVMGEFASKTVRDKFKLSDYKQRLLSNLERTRVSSGKRFLN